MVASPCFSEEPLPNWSVVTWLAVHTDDYHPPPSSSYHYNNNNDNNNNNNNNIDRRIYLNLSKSTQSAVGMKALKSTVPTGAT